MNGDGFYYFFVVLKGETVTSSVLTEGPIPDKLVHQDTSQSVVQESEVMVDQTETSFPSTAIPRQGTHTANILT